MPISAGSRPIFLANIGRDAAEQFGGNNGCDQGQGDDDCHTCLLIGQIDPQSVGDSEDNTHDQGNTEFFPDDTEKVMEGYLIQGDSADDQGGTLRTTVSAGVHQHRDEGYQKRDCPRKRFHNG